MMFERILNRTLYFLEAANSIGWKRLVIIAACWGIPIGFLAAFYPQTQFVLIMVGVVGTIVTWHIVALKTYKPKEE